MEKLQQLMQRNYDATRRRGLITDKTRKTQFVNKMYEEIEEFDNERDPEKQAIELADYLLVGFAYAVHKGIDIISVMEKKVEFNETRK